MSGRIGCQTKAYSFFGRIPHWKEGLNMLSSLRKFSINEIAQERLRIIKFYEQHREKATKEAFGADRKVVSR